ncbi:hypothetical protein NTE15_002467 [Vibrio cholerae]|uniref:hypothetical protein n=1 Tax=Vibrio cholerae TaxID=666 RepID=UPI00158415DB|nr:hypothetical protein [Vibrio cholerae]EKF9989451.1 hypothetical protein [Vibrio cholerae]ELL1566716.1 hypothetical protein [Vibrio cholerae]
MLNHQQSVVYGLSLLPWLVSFVFLGKLAQWALFSGHLFFGAGNSQNCLSQFSGKREVGSAGSIRNLILGFFVLTAKVQSLIFKIMSHFSFLVFGFFRESKLS